MTLDDLELPAGTRADLDRYADELDMSEGILCDHILETFAPAEGDDLDRLRLNVEACIRAHERRQIDDLGEEIE